MLMENHFFVHQQDLQPRSYSLHKLSGELFDLFATVPLVGGMELLASERPWNPHYHPTFAAFFLIVGIVISALLFALVFASQYVRVVLSSRGVTFYSWGFQIYTPWNNVLGVFSTNSFRKKPLSPRLSALLPHQAVATQYLKLKNRAHVVYRVGEGVQSDEATMVVQWWYPFWMRAIRGNAIPLPGDLAQEDWIHDDLKTFLQHYVPGYAENRQSS